jgi:cell division protease FtsH
MSDKFNNIAFGSQREQVFLGEQMGSSKEYSENTAREVDEEVLRILKEAYDRAMTAITEHRDILDKLADELIEHEEVSGRKVMQWLNGSTEEEPVEEETQEKTTEDTKLKENEEPADEEE